MQKVIHREAGRGTKDLGWLLSKLSFSFSGYQNAVMKGFGTLKVLNDDTVQREAVLEYMRMLTWKLLA
ncbi:MAG: pirin family protein [Segetibacter sp.]|nr:pirin family protein [Segetibacter sp.]